MKMESYLATKSFIKENRYIQSMHAGSSCCYSIYIFYSLFAIQVSGKISVLKDGPFAVNVSAEQTMVVVNKLITGLTYTFSVRYQKLILT